MNDADRVMIFRSDFFFYGSKVAAVSQNVITKIGD